VTDAAGNVTRGRPTDLNGSTLWDAGRQPPDVERLAIRPSNRSYFYYDSYGRGQPWEHPKVIAVPARAFWSGAITVYDAERQPSRVVQPALTAQEDASGAPQTTVSFDPMDRSTVATYFRRGRPATGRRESRP